MYSSQDPFVLFDIVCIVLLDQIGAFLRHLLLKGLGRHLGHRPAGCPHIAELPGEDEYQIKIFQTFQRLPVFKGNRFALPWSTGPG